MKPPPFTTLNLHVRRVGVSSDRVYTITVESRDHAGNAAKRIP